MRRQWQLTLTGGALVVLSVANSLCARASDLERHNELVKAFVIADGAYPLVADCAAHADFVMRTLPSYGGVEFPANAFDAAHSSILPSWSDRFDGGRQRVKVDTVVSIVGLVTGKSRTGTAQALKFCCGYEDGGGDGMLMLAFSWSKSPLPVDWRKSPGEGLGNGLDNNASDNVAPPGNNTDTDETTVNQRHR
jgi:hypothetical protein